MARTDPVDMLVGLHSSAGPVCAPDVGGALADLLADAGKPERA